MLGRPNPEFGARVAGSVHGLRALPITFMLLVASCSALSNEGAPPPEGAISFPVGIALDDAAAPSRLYVLSSNFDLRYNSAAVQTYDLDTLEAALQTNCVAPRAGLTEEECEAAPGCAIPEECVVVPDQLQNPDDAGGALLVTQVSGLLLGEALLGSYASAIANSPDGNRLYISVRSDADLTHIDVSPSGELSCGGTPGVRHECTRDFREVDVEDAAARSVELPSDPVDLFVGSLSDLTPGAAGNYILMAHRDGQVSYIFDDPAGDAGPELRDVSQNEVAELVTITSGPDGVAWMPSQRSTLIARAGLTLSGLAGEDAHAALVYDAGPVAVARLDTSFGDIREVKFDSSGRAVLLSRIPTALLFTGTAPEADRSLAVDGLVEVGQGPSRVVLGMVEGREFAFVSCFDSRDIYVIDLERRVVATVIRGMSGPFEMSIDPTRNRLYVADFRTSAVRVVDISPLGACLTGPGVEGRECAPELIGVLGRPVAAEEVR